MEKFLVNYTGKSKPPPKKKKKSDEEREMARRKYEETDRKREFQHRWLELYDWLMYEKVNGTYKMFCKFCKNTYGAGVFCTGARNFKVDSIKSHDDSVAHKDAVAKVTAEKKGGSADKFILDGSLSSESLKVLFRTAHAIALNGRPFLDFSWLIDLQVANGVNIANMYKNDKR